MLSNITTISSQSLSEWCEDILLFGTVLAQYSDNISNLPLSLEWHCMPLCGWMILKQLDFFSILPSNLANICHFFCRFPEIESWNTAFLHPLYIMKTLYAYVWMDGCISCILEIFRRNERAREDAFHTWSPHWWHPAVPAASWQGSGHQSDH